VVGPIPSPRKKIIFFASPAALARLANASAKVAATIVRGSVRDSVFFILISVLNNVEK
jgi:hypothetical protein